MPILSWLTRDRDVQAADAVPYRLLERDDTLSAGDTSSGNMLIQGDNLEALKSLLPYFRGQVKCIYIDPPYNTDAAVGDMFEDNFSHSQWLGIMWPRLELLEEILSEDGLFICSIDDKESAYLTVVLDEIFGRDNRINTVAVKMSEASGVKMAHADKRLPKLKEWLLIYGKRNRPKFNIDLIPPEKWNEEYKTVITGNSRDEINRLKDLISKQPATQADVEECQKILATCRMQSMSNFCRQNHIDDSNLDGWRFENSWRIVQAVGSSSVYNLALRSKKSGGDISAGLSSTGLIYLFKSEVNLNAKSPRIQIIFADQNLMTHPGDFWTDIKTTRGIGKEGGVHFPNSKKPERLIQRIIGLCTEEGDYVLDSFLGSGTTAAVAHKMGRRWIGIEMGNHAMSHCAPRLRNVIDGEQGGISKAVNWQGGGGFAFYRLGAPVFDSNGTIAPSVNFAPLATHIWFAETGKPFTGAADKPFLGACNGQGLALLYNGILGDKRVSGGNVLTRKTLAMVRAAAGGFAGPITIYGEANRLGAEALKAERITFKQTPYDVRAR